MAPPSDQAIASPVADRARPVVLAPLVAGFVTVLVGFTSSYAVILEAARAMGMSAAQVATMTAALALGMGLTTLVPSVLWRVPIVTAWSTPGAALLATAAAGVPLPAAVGAFVACGLALAAVGASGRFESLMARVPLPIASALLAGILARFGMEAFASLQSSLALAAPMVLAWALARRVAPRFAVPIVLLVGLAAAWAVPMLGTAGLLAGSAGGGAAGTAAAGVAGAAAAGALAGPKAWSLPALDAVMPALDVAALLGVALPLFVVTMASQNVPGVAVLRASGYADAPVSKAVAITGAATALLAPFGVFALNLAAITAALCMGRDAHPDPARRWLAAAAAGGFYCAVALVAGPIVSLFVSLPRATVIVLAGLALMPTIARGLQVAMEHDDERETALVTFLVTASGVTIAGLGSAFWGVVLGLAVRAAWRTGRGR